VFDLDQVVADEAWQPFLRHCVDVQCTEVHGQTSIPKRVQREEQGLQALSMRAYPTSHMT
jgi:hypothetical protein